MRNFAVVTLMAVVVALGAGPAWAQTEGDGDRIIAGAIDTPTADAIERDPFRPFLKQVRRKTVIQKGPLQCCEVLSFQLVAVIMAGNNPRAMVEDKAGIGYTITEGTPIGQNGGVVKEIKPDRVVVEEIYLDAFDNERSTTIVMQLEPEADEG